jgi:hypothetical protein
VDTLPPDDAAPFISGFQFTNGATFKERFKVPVTIGQPEDNLITVSVNAFVPAVDVAAPAGTLFIDLVIGVAGCMLKTGMATRTGTQGIQLPYNSDEIPAQVLKFHVPIRKGSLTVTAAWLQYYIMKNNHITRVENPAFMPAGVINARFQ